jgi:hypothetical protein
MTGLFRKANAWLAGTMRRAANETVAIVRGSSKVTGVACVGWDREYEVFDTEGIQHYVTIREWLIDRDAYEVNGVIVEPRQGDVLIDEDGRQWELQPQANRKEKDRHGTDWILRTKLIEVPVT